jgi:hypothetical protein
MLRLFRRNAALRYLMSAHRYSQEAYFDRVVVKEKERLKERMNGFVEYVTIDQLDSIAKRAIVLKQAALRHGNLEKGVLLLSFTHTFPFYHSNVDCENLLRYFYIVLEPSWAGYCDPSILFWMNYPKHRVFVQTTEERDCRFLNSLKSNLIPVPFGASDWVDFRLFRPIDGVNKEYDAVYVTNYSLVKRNHVLFKAISEIRNCVDSNYRVALVFGKNGNAQAEIDYLIDYYGIRRNIAIYDGVTQEKVNEVLNMAKVNLLLSLKEGSNRSIFEGFFANVPGIILKDNIGVKKEYINDETGMIIAEKELTRALIYFRKNAGKYNPRKWALENISPIITAKKLSNCIQKIAEENQEPWFQEVVPKVNTPELTYFSPADHDALPSSRSTIALFLKQRH